MTTIMFLFLLICSQNFKSCKELWVPITKGTLNLTGLEENNNGIFQEKRYFQKELFRTHQKLTFICLADTIAIYLKFKCTPPNSNNFSLGLWF